MNETRLMQSRLINDLKSFVLICLMSALLGFLAYVIAGPVLAVGVLVFIGAAYWLSPGMAPKLVMRFFKARPLSYMEAPQLFRILTSLSSRAGLANLPELYLIPNGSMAAFATGHSGKSAVALSAGLIKRLEPHEVAAVVAHEISHIRNNDMRSMWFALLISRVTDSLSMVGQVLLFINLPLILFNQVSLSWVPILVLVFAPFMSFVVQLTLSRVNEFNADLGSAQLMGSPEPLISALAKIEMRQRGLLGYLFPGRAAEGQSSLFRTHPPTKERIRRLKGVGLENTRRPSIPFEPAQRIVHRPRVYTIPARRHFWFEP